MALLHPHSPGTIVTVQAQLYEVESYRPTHPDSAKPLRGKLVYSLRRISDGTRWRVTCRDLHRHIALAPAAAWA